MACKILTTDKFEKQAKRLIKKYPSLKIELLKLEESLTENPKQGTSLGNNFYKIRLAIKSKGKGKSGGARVINYLIFNSFSIGKVDKVYLSTIYDKSEYQSISNKDLENILSELEIL
jgi:hypothetical protein